MQDNVIDEAECLLLFFKFILSTEDRNYIESSSIVALSLFCAELNTEVIILGYNLALKLHTHTQTRKYFLKKLCVGGGGFPQIYKQIQINIV